MKREFEFVKYTVLPLVKVRLLYFWWSVRYRGRKNIPPELIFKQIESNFSKMREELDIALRYIPHDSSHEEVEKLLEVIKEVAVVENEVQDARQKRTQTERL